MILLPYTGPSANATSESSTTLPDPPTSISTSTTSSQITLSWDPSSGATSYKVQRSTLATGPYSTITPNSYQTTSYTDSGLQAGTTYYYCVYAANSAGISGGTSVSATTALAVPSAPTSLLTTLYSPSQINLSWSAPTSSGGAAITGYKIERSTNGGATWSVVVANTGTTSTTYSNLGLSSSTTYTYRVSAINSVGTGTPSNTSYATTTVELPNPPASLSATVISNSQIDLLWDQSLGADSYRIDRSNSPSSGFVSISTVASTYYSDISVTFGATYYYRVYAVNSAGASSSYAFASSTTSVALPNPPTSLLATAVSSSQINLSWNPSAGATAYKIEFSTPRIDPFNPLTTINHPATSYSHTGLTSNTPYHYRIYAVNAVGQSAPVSTSATTLAPQSELEPEIPDWIKNLAGWWADGIMDDNSFVNAVKWLIQNDIIQIEATTSGSSGASEIPPWVKNTAKWWSEGIVSDREFINALKYLIEIGIIVIR